MKRFWNFIFSAGPCDVGRWIFFFFFFFVIIFNCIHTKTLENAHISRHINATGIFIQIYFENRSQPLYSTNKICGKKIVTKAICNCLIGLEKRVRREWVESEKREQNKKPQTHQRPQKYKSQRIIIKEKYNK